MLRNCVCYLVHLGCTVICIGICQINIWDQNKTKRVKCVITELQTFKHKASVYIQNQIPTSTLFPI